SSHRSASHFVSYHAPTHTPRRLFFFFTRTSPPELSPLSLHDALPIYGCGHRSGWLAGGATPSRSGWTSSGSLVCADQRPRARPRSEEHTSELQSRENLVCRLLLEKKKHKRTNKSSISAAEVTPHVL